MMIDVTVSNTFQGSVAQVFTHMNPLMARATLLSHSATRAVFETADGAQFVITGTGMTWGVGGAGRPDPLLGGTVEAMIYREGNRDLVTFANLQTTGDVLWAAIRAERDGSDPQALIGVLSKHCWTYRGSNGNDVFGQTDVGGFGVPDLGGNDRINLNNGDDQFHTGAANDTIVGGAGQDWLSGGTENDLLFGGSGDDQLLGGNDEDRLSGGGGADRLWGDAGNDSLSGGLGNDWIEGGRGDDRLSGGPQGDHFVFAAGSGDDVITDFQVGLDVLDLTWTRRTQIVDLAGDALIVSGRNSVLLLGVQAQDVTLADLM